MERRGPRGARARYQADHDAVTKVHIPNINGVSLISKDGEFVVTYTHPLLQSSSGLEIQVVPQEYSSYPSEHFFVVFACSNEVSTAITKSLEDFAASSSGVKIHEALTALSRNLTASIERQATEGILGEVEDTVMTDVENEDLGTEDDGNDFEDFDDNHGYNDDDDIFGLVTDHHMRTSTAFDSKIAPAALARIRRDFRTVRKGGFLISKICGFDEPTENNIASIAVQVDKLCLSEETLDAWNLKVNDYVVLLIRYKRHYTTFAESLDKAAHSSNIDFRLRKCTKYKPTVQQALEAFTAPVSKWHCSSPILSQINNSTNGDETGLTLLGIGESIDTFMNQDFVPLLKLRNSQNWTWDTAKQQLVALSRKLHTEQQDSFDFSQDEMLSKGTESSDSFKLPAFVANDHLLANGEISLPLVAAQFAMRYLVRCTDYCMVCHQQVDGNFEALKPYVCGDSLCLFQYMSMGFGPSIDLEVINQPNVVDLLISFCYAGLQKITHGGSPSGLREYPTGLNLQIPKIFPHNYTNLEGVEKVVAIEGGKLIDPIIGRFNCDNSSIILDTPLDVSKVKEGMWVVVVVVVRMVHNADASQTILHHGRIEHITGHTVSIQVASRHTLPVSSVSDGTISVNATQADLSAYLVLYDQNLDDTDDITKAFAMTILLAATPSVSSMREYLQVSPNRQLEKWERLIPSASKLLRWIVASNRSFIVQVDELASEEGAKIGTSLARNHERISGVDGWIQFRFAQGSPEKELQFQEELKNVNKPQKTILGWHGSHISNWHSIIREGLDFKTVVNGRSYGDGVYFGRDFDTSLGYSGIHRLPHGEASNALVWPNSALKFDAAVSLSEIVNKPSEFVNNQRMEWCYVVKHIHWIQCRYLFVRPQTACLTVRENDKNSKECEFIQDPQYVASGPKRTKIFVPKVAIPSAQDDTLKQNASSLKPNAVGHIEGCEGEDPEDIDFLLSDDSDVPVISRTGTPIQQRYPLNTPAVPLLRMDKTDFRPNTLDLSTLPQLAPPSYATSQGQKQIGQEIKKLQKVQSTTPVHELGWYINFENITNMFHWIAELHSFDADLPLAKDMKKSGVSSIVLEIRFGREYPISPPFLRVIRPRFLPFGSGGGGHVTLGGAMCMELLTNSGWSPANSLESVLLQVRMALCSVDPRPARLESTKGLGRDYGIGEAYEAYTRAAMTHGWQVPRDLLEATTSMMVQAPGV